MSDELSREAAARQLKLTEEKRHHEEALRCLAELSDDAIRLQREIDARRGKLSASRLSLDALGRQRDAEYKRLRDQDRDIQRQQFLDTHYISKADIQGITRALKSALASFSIETAADVNYTAVAKVPGFGKVRTKRMIDWRNKINSGFRYKPTADLPAAQKRAIDNKFNAGRLRVARDFHTAKGELERRISELTARIAPAKQRADQAALTFAVARASRQAIS